MQQRVIELLEQGLGPMDWTVVEPESPRNCTSFPGIAEAESRLLEAWRSPRSITDDDWPRAIGIVRSITAEHGFEPPEIVINRSGDHEVTSNDTYGAVYSFGTATGTELSVTTGCHLRAARTA